MLTQLTKGGRKGKFEKRQKVKLFNVIPMLGKTLNSQDMQET